MSFVDTAQCACAFDGDGAFDGEGAFDRADEACAGILDEQEGAEEGGEFLRGTRRRRAAVDSHQHAAALVYACGANDTVHEFYP